MVNRKHATKFFVLSACILNHFTYFLAGYEHTKSTELFDLESLAWTSGPELPIPLAGAASLSYGNEALLIGGHVVKKRPQDSAYSNRIFQFEFYRTFWSSIFYPNTYYGRWVEREETLEFATAEFPAFWVPNRWCS